MAGSPAVTFHLASSIVSLLPVLTFLAVLLYFDSYKLVRLRFVLAIVLCGAAVAAVSYSLNALAITMLDIGVATYARGVAPFIEELLKAGIVVVLIRTHRIGFPVDAAICGFAVGTGFAVVENLYFLRAIPDAGMTTWIVRGFGTAFMHGGVTAIFAIITLVLRERAPLARALALLPGFAIAVVLHMGYNALSQWPRLAAICGLVLLAPLLYVVFRYSERAVGSWLGRGFDADAEMLQLINSGELSNSRIGRYLTRLKERFQGPVVADLLCYLRVYTELALRAKGMLMMRESGFEVPMDDATRAKFEELRYLEGSIGKTGLRAVTPMRHISDKELWQLNMLRD
jgi:RsiW-degrading membrane proteinase PrsW (M82 family)